MPQDAAVREMPQLSDPDFEPQVAPSLAQKVASVSGVQPQTPGVLPPEHVCGAAHVPQEATVLCIPQLSTVVTDPQDTNRLEQNAESVSGMQPHTFGMPVAPQLFGAAQVPQEATLRDAAQLSIPL